VSLRLGPDQRADDIFQLYSDFVRQIAPPSVDVDVRCLSKTDPVLVPRDNPFIQAAQCALRRVFQCEPVLVRSGGSIPVVSVFQNGLKMPSVLMGFGLPDSNIHAPNENLLLANYYRGIESIILFFEELGGA
jgi:acetylornithine deacetylase/succinyl-diaminopimelate desuccinylase-like protein